MLQGIFDAILDFFDLVWGLIKFIISLFEDLVWLITHLTDFVAMVPNFFTPLPPAIVATIGVCLSIIIVLRILGRDE